MANQLNFPDPLEGLNPERPERISKVDLDLMQVGSKQTVFGTTTRDNVEVWLYNPDGSMAAHLRLDPTDPALGVLTMVDNGGSYEVVTLDLTAISKRVALEPGKYGLVANFLRDEVGGELGNKMYISEISDDRLELRLYPWRVNPDMTRQIYEFIVPSVPRIYAQGLIDQTMARSLDYLETESVSVAKISQELVALQSNVLNRLQYAEVFPIYRNIVEKILDRTHRLALQYMADDPQNYNIQQADLEEYVFTAINDVIKEMVDGGEIDHRMVLIQDNV